jgi:hypothetical protein
MISDRRFNIVLPGRTFEFRVSDSETCHQWFGEVKRYIDQSDCCQYKVVQEIKRAWKFDNISEKQFLQEADTGDLLLFKSESAPSFLTRAFTNSQFDHVAMILKFENEEDEIFLVEATGNYGVSLNKWGNLRANVGNDKFYRRIIYRKIDFERDDRMVDSLELFLKEAIGQNYGMTPGKLFRNHTMAKTEKDREMIDSSRTFFCSELVAKAFKVLGIL